MAKCVVAVKQYSTGVVHFLSQVLHFLFTLSDACVMLGPLLLVNISKFQIPYFHCGVLSD